MSRRDQEEAVRQFNETAMPCPGCGEKLQRKIATDNGHPIDGKDYAVCCPSCQLPIVEILPLFALAAPPYGWRWVRADDKSYFKEAPSVFP